MAARKFGSALQLLSRGPLAALTGPPFFVRCSFQIAAGISLAERLAVPDVNPRVARHCATVAG